MGTSEFWVLVLLQCTSPTECKQMHVGVIWDQQVCNFIGANMARGDDRVTSYSCTLEEVKRGLVS